MAKQSEPSKLFVIYGYKDVVHAVLSTPTVTEPSVVTAAWAYAVTYSAKGLNIPDYEAAVELLKQRHPSWQVLSSSFTRIELSLADAIGDTPEA